MTYPRHRLRKRATDDGTSDRTYAPHCANDSEPLASLPQRHHIGDQNLGEGYEAAASNTLERSANKKGPEPVRRRSNDGADEKKDKSHHDEGFSTEYVRKFGETRLKDCGGKKERCTSPKSFDCGSFQSSCHYLNVYSVIDYRK